MDVYWGVDSSYYPANRKIKVRGRHCTVWEFICEEASVLTFNQQQPGFDLGAPLLPPAGVSAAALPGALPPTLRLPGYRQPDFWGRYLGRHQITTAEAEYIFEQSNGRCRILLAYNNVGPVGVAGNRQAGLDAARDAVAQATALNVPRGTFIYCDIEGKYNPSVDFIQGWWEGMRDSTYGGRGGIYCKTTAPNFVNPYLTAVRADNPNLWPDFPFWARYLWTTRPQVPHQHKPGAYSTFAPIEPSDRQGGLSGVTVIHQYALDKYGMVDFDVANQKGYDSMWRASPTA
jgi:hypothetical protein